MYCEADIIESINANSIYTHTHSTVNICFTPLKNKQKKEKRSKIAWYRFSFSFYADYVRIFRRIAKSFTVEPRVCACTGRSAVVHCARPFDWKIGCPIKNIVFVSHIHLSDFLVPEKDFADQTRFEHVKNAKRHKKYTLYMYIVN